MMDVVFSSTMPVGAAPPSADRTLCDRAVDEVPADLDFEEFDQVLKRFEALEPRSGRLVELRFFGGLSLEEAATVLNVSTATAKRDWALARAWLQRELALS